MEKHIGQVKTLIKYVIIFITIIASMIVLMIGAAKIPKKLIKQNMIKSAEYLNQKETYYEIIENHSETKIDHYADAITLNIVYNLQQTDSFKSILYAKYYNNNDNKETENLLNTVTQDECKPETQYMRYWHGTMIILKVLLIAFNIKQIYIINAIVLLILLGFLIYKLVKNKMNIVAVGIILALIVTNSYCVPFALEYVNMYFVTIISSILLIYLLEKKKDKNITVLFFITGIFTCFFDFLTTETITLTVPLIIFIIYKYNEYSKIIAKKMIILIVKLVLIWLIGYTIMWIAKWGIASVYLKCNIKEVAIDNALERIGKANVYEINFGKKISKNVIFRNIYCLFPICNFDNQGIILSLFIFTLFTVIFFIRKNKITIFHFILITIALVPYIRYILINNHSYIHYFFTYRAQLTTIIAIITVVYYLVHKTKKRRAKK